MKNSEVFLVTGGCGFLGRRLIQLILKSISRCKIVVIDKKRNTYLNYTSNVKYIFGDLKDPNLLDKVPNDVKCIFHLAAVIPWDKNKINDTDIAVDNLLPIINIIKKTRKWKKLKNFIFSSSVSVYTPIDIFLNEKMEICPVNIYGAAKAAGESLLTFFKRMDIKVAFLRYSSIYGYGQYPGTVLPTMIKNALCVGKILIKGDKSRTQDFLYCDDAAWANILAYKKNAEGIFNIGSGIPVTLNKLAQKISKIFTDGSASLKYTAKSTNTPGYKIDITKAKMVLGFNPIFQIQNGLEALKKEME